MIEIEINHENLEKFVADIRDEDEQELIAVLGCDYRDELFRLCLSNKSQTYFLADSLSRPCAIGGVSRFCNDEKIGQVWLLCTNRAVENKIALFKYISRKITEFKREYDLLFNFIYKSNYKALNWLSVFGFVSFDIKNVNDYKFFFCRSLNK